MPFDDDDVDPGGGGDVDDGSFDDSTSTGEPGAGGNEDTDPDGALGEDDLIDRVDREALDSFEPEDEDEDESGTGEGKGKGKKSTRRASHDDDPLDEFIRKNYGGNRQAFVDSQIANRAEAKRLAEENADLKRRMESSVKPPPPVDREKAVKDAQEANAEVQSLNQSITNLAGSYRKIEARQLEIVAEVNKLNGDAIRIEAELPHTEDHKEWSKKYAESGRARADITALRAEYMTNETRLESLADKVDTRKEKLAALRKSIADEMDQRERVAKAEKQDVMTTQRIFKGSFDQAIRPFNLDPVRDKGRLTYIRNTVRAQTWDHLTALAQENGDEGLDAGQMYELVSGLVREYARQTGLRSINKRNGRPEERRPSDRQIGVRRSAPGAGGGRPRDNGEGEGGGEGSGSGSNLLKGTRYRTMDEAMSDPNFVRKRAALVRTAIAKNAERARTRA